MFRFERKKDKKKRDSKAKRGKRHGLYIYRLVELKWASTRIYIYKKKNDNLGVGPLRPNGVSHRFPHREVSFTESLRKGRGIKG